MGTPDCLSFQPSAGKIIYVALQPDDTGVRVYRHPQIKVRLLRKHHIALTAGIEVSRPLRAA